MAEDLYDIMLMRTQIDGVEVDIEHFNIPKETKVRDLLPENFDSDNHPFRLNVHPPLVDIDDTLEEICNKRISPVHEFAGSSNKLLLLVPVPAVVPPDTDGNSDTSSDSGGSISSLYRAGLRARRKSKRKQRRKSKSRKRKSKSKKR